MLKVAVNIILYHEVKNYKLPLMKMIMTNTEHATYFVRANIYLLINFTIKFIIKFCKFILNSTCIQFWFYSFS